MKLLKRMMGVVTALVLCLFLLVSASALTVEQALELLEENYLRQIPAEAYEAESLDQLFSILGDPYTYYMDPEQKEAFTGTMEDTSLVGLGVSIQFTQEGILVVDLLDGGAKAAGILPGDIIVEADGRSCVPGNEIQREWLMGEEGTVVSLVVDRAGERLSFDVTRSVVQILHTNSSLMDDYIGYIDCDSFGTATPGHFRNAIKTYGSQADSWLVDMRQNSGGSANAAVETIGIFGGPGFHLYLRDNTGKLSYYQSRSRAATDKRLIVLVDDNSASGAEAFSAAVRDHGLGVLVGQRTFGKGVAQIVLDEKALPDYFPEGGSLKITTYRFFSPLGVTNDEVGVIPHLVVDEAQAVAVARALCREYDDSADEQLMFMMGGTGLVLDPDAVEGETLAALFEAFTPKVELQLQAEGQVRPISVAEAAEHFGIVYDSRWFADVGDSAYAEEINTLAAYELIAGDEEGLFAPLDTMTRAEACVMIAKAMDLNGVEKQMFTDVAADHPAAPYINALCRMGWVNGVGGGKFNPDGQMSRQEYITLMGRMLRFINVNADRAADAYTEEQLAQAAEMGFAPWACEGALMLDVQAGESGVKAPILREEAAYWLHQTLLYGGLLVE